MDNITTLAMMASLSESHCELNHGPNTRPEDYQAVDYLVQPMGKTNGENKEDDLSHIAIPLCKECTDGLIDPSWILLYCLDCHSNQWLSREKAKLEYGLYDIIWFKGCPKCSEKPTAIYFD